MIQPLQLKEMKSILCFKVYKLIFLMMMVNILGCLSSSNCQIFFAIMAFDKLKASKEDLDTAAQCEQMGPLLFDNCMKHLHLSDD